MSYARMDHAEWVESNNAAGRKMLGRRKRKYNSLGSPLGYAAAPDHLSEFQAKVMDILGMVYGGIYNALISWNTVDWHCGTGISLVVRQGNGWSTFDFKQLTMFVFLCHEARIRGEIQLAGFGYRLYFHPRVAEGGMSKRHPNLDEAVAEFRKYLPSDHRILYRDVVPDAGPDSIPDKDPT